MTGARKEEQLEIVLNMVTFLLYLKLTSEHVEWFNLQPSELSGCLDMEDLCLSQQDLGCSNWQACQMGSNLGQHSTIHSSLPVLLLKKSCSSNDPFMISFDESTNGTHQWRIDFLKRTQHHYSKAFLAAFFERHLPGTKLGRLIFSRTSWKHLEKRNQTSCRSVRFCLPFPDILMLSVQVAKASWQWLITKQD